MTLRAAATLCALLVAMVLPISAQQSAETPSAADVVRGIVVDAQGNTIGAAVVRLENSQGVATQTVSSPAGAFSFSGVIPGTYRLSAENPGLHSQSLTLRVPLRNHDPFRLILQDSTPAAAHPPMAYSDAPNFAIAGVTDWTAIGGHGSDANLRTSEELARDTLALKSPNSVPTVSSPADNQTEMQLRAALAASPGSFAANHRLGEFYLGARRYRESLPLLESAWRIDPKNDGNTYDLALACRGVGDLQQARAHITALLAHGANPDWYRLAGDLEEQSENPLAAVHDYEKAVDLDPDEPNYFALGSELLLHRAIWQAQQVFRKGVAAWPESLRLQIGFGAALFAGALYDQAALRLCAASDADPAATEPYLFMGRIEIAAPNPLPCIRQKLARFAEQQPGNSTANYLYAMAILKSHEHAPNPQEMDQAEILLRKAVTSDAANGDAWFQLGTLASTRHDYPAAIDDYRKAIDADPQLADAYYRLAVVYDRSGDSLKAKQEFLLHAKIAQSQQEATNQQRKKIQQFLFEQSAPPPH
ncbi:MAG: tetratricopeptide repeat protein [Acidobacteriaceae bacterium]